MSLLNVNFMNGEVFIRAEEKSDGSFDYKFVWQRPNEGLDEGFVYLSLNENPLQYDKKPIYAKIINPCGYDTIKKDEYVLVDDVYYQKNFEFTSFRKLDEPEKLLIIHRNCLQFDWFNE